MLRRALLCAALLCGALSAPAAFALPNLQLYIEGATYDAMEESWIIDDANFRLWVISDGPTTDVKLAAAYATSETGTISLTPSTTGGYGGFTDPSTPGAPVLTIAGGNDGDQPLLSDGDPLPPHGIYGAGTSFHQWSLGDMTLNDSPTADFITSFPTAPFPSTGQINVYEVSVTGFSKVHFDAFDGVLAGNHVRAVFAPFSHDAEGGGDGELPEPGMLGLFGAGLVGLAGSRLRRK